MGLAEHGVNLSPPELNQKLTAINGYTDKGWVKWSAVRIATEGKIWVDIPRRASPAVIDSSLASGNPVLVKVYLSPEVYHWVLVVGREGHEYLIKDPLGDGKSLTLLSGLNSDVHSLRIVRKS